MASLSWKVTRECCPRPMPFEVGQTVTDVESGESVTVSALTMVPAGTNLFGDAQPAHVRYRVTFFDGRWADRTEGDLQ